MEVKDEVSFNNKSGYSIEWGYSTWSKDESVDQKDWSIRNRYSTQYGGFNIRGSSEVPWEDFKLMISESIKRNHFEKEDLAAMLKDISECLVKNY